MERDSSKQAGWLDTAVAGIRFGPDRAAVRAELEAHLEDKQADLRRIFPDMLPEDAEARALEDMGDPAEIGKELARIHKPWLGYLWRASKWIAILLVVLLMAANILNNDHYQSAGYPLWGAFSTVHGPQEGEKTELGGYTFQIVGAAYLDYPEDWPSFPDRVQVAVRVSTPRFWERIDQDGLKQALTLTDGAGQQWSMRTVVIGPGEEAPERMSVLYRAEWGLFHDTYLAEVETTWQEGDRIQLEFTFGKGSFTLAVDELKRVVME